MSRRPVSTDARAAMDKTPFLTDVKALRERARQHIGDGAVTRGYEGDTEIAVQVLNAALATELVCVLRYKRHYFMARGIHSGSVATEFREHAGEELHGPGTDVQAHPVRRDRRQIERRACARRHTSVRGWFGCSDQCPASGSRRTMACAIAPCYQIPDAWREEKSYGF